MSLRTQAEALYKDYPEIPFISPTRNLEEWLAQVSLSRSKLVPRRNMERLAEGFLPGHIILLWRVSHGTYTNESVISKYFEHTYGIDGKLGMAELLESGYVLELSAHDSLNQVTAPLLKKALKNKGVVGISKMKKEDIVQAIHEHLSEEELGQYFTVREYRLTDTGQKMLNDHPEVVDRHPKKPGY